MPAVGARRTVICSYHWLCGCRLYWLWGSALAASVQVMPFEERAARPGKFYDRVIALTQGRSCGKANASSRDSGSHHLWPRHFGAAECFSVARPRLSRSRKHDAAVGSLAKRRDRPRGANSDRSDGCIDWGWPPGESWQPPPLDGAS